MEVTNLRKNLSIEKGKAVLLDDIGDTGTVYIEKHDKGAGVQNEFLKVSKWISDGGDKDEELIFTYNAPVLLDDIIPALNDIEFGK